MKYRVLSMNFQSSLVVWGIQGSSVCSVMAVRALATIGLDFGGGRDLFGQGKVQPADRVDAGSFPDELEHSVVLAGIDFLFS